MSRPTDGLREATVARLERAGCVQAEAEAAELLDAAPDVPTLKSWLDRRERGEPLAWLTGWTRFCGRRLAVHRGVYVPRHQTEELATRAASLLPADGRALDLCTGTGAIAAHLGATVPSAAVVGVEVDPRAVACARANGVRAVRADVSALPLAAGPGFDVVTAVAPYVPTGELRLLPADVRRHEPRLALDGGDDGLGLVREVCAAAAQLLRPGGWMLVELGGEQDRLLAAVLAASGFLQASAWHDDEGDLRGVAAQAWPGAAAIARDA